MLKSTINLLFEVQSHHQNGLRALLGKDVINTLIKPSDGLITFLDNNISALGGWRVSEDLQLGRGGRRVWNQGARGVDERLRTASQSSLRGSVDVLFVAGGGDTVLVDGFSPGGVVSSRDISWGADASRRAETDSRDSV